MIYLKIAGRIGNQLFMYATARTIQYLTGGKQEIVIDALENRAHDTKQLYENSLIHYDLKNVRFVNDDSVLKKELLIQYLFRRLIGKIEYEKTPRQIAEFEIKFQRWFNLVGIYKLQDEYMTYPKIFRGNTYVEGYFQSEKFFEPVRDEIKQIFRLDGKIDKENYPDIDMIEERNTVCISIKVQHNVNDPAYDVCDSNYYKKAIEYICRKVDDPLFMICSDNVQYVKDNLIDCSKYEVVEQDRCAPVHIALAAMARCKHFIIGNSSFAWWAQYLSDYDKKLVIAPHHWYGTDIPCHIYQDNWIQIDKY